MRRRAKRTPKRAAKPAARRVTKSTAARAKKRTVVRRRASGLVEEEARGEIAELVEEMKAHPETGPALTGGDVDADWTRAHLSGEEAAGGSVATPDQDVVEEIGRALGVEQGADAPVRTSEEILRDRDRQRWTLEREAADADEGRPSHRRSRP